MGNGCSAAARAQPDQWQRFLKGLPDLARNPHGPGGTPNHSPDASSFRDIARTIRILGNHPTIFASCVQTSPVIGGVTAPEADDLDRAGSEPEPHQRGIGFTEPRCLGYQFRPQADKDSLPAAGFARIQRAEFLQPQLPIGGKSRLPACVSPVPNRSWPKGEANADAGRERPNRTSCRVWSRPFEATGGTARV